jgi:hypothetical protein
MLCSGIAGTKFMEDTGLWIANCGFPMANCGRDALLRVRSEPLMSEGRRLRRPGTIQRTPEESRRRLYGSRYVMDGFRASQATPLRHGAGFNAPRLLAIDYLLAPAVNPPLQYFPSRMNAATSGKTLMNEPSAIRW